MARILWLVLAVAACSDSRILGPVPPPPVPAKGQLRVMSYNVNFGIAGDASSIEAIAGAQPDLVFLQETNAVWEREIAEQLGARYPHRRFDPPVDWVAGGMGLLSRYPIVKLETLVAPMALFFAWRVVIDSPLGRIQV